MCGRDVEKGMRAWEIEQKHHGKGVCSAMRQPLEEEGL